MSGFDPIIALNRHIALLALREDAAQEVKKRRGIVQHIIKGAGRSIVRKLEQSKETMRANKMWVQDNPIGERRYLYSLFGRRETYEISRGDLELHVGMILGELERELESLG